MRDRVNLVVLAQRWYQPVLAVGAVIAVLLAYRNGILRNTSRIALGDLHIYRETLSQWWAARETVSLYDVRSAIGAPFIYPPSAIPILLPITWIPVAALDALWSASLVALCAMAAWLIVRRAPRGSNTILGTHPETSHLITVGALVTAIVLASQPLAVNAFWGNVSVYIAILILFDIAGVVPERLRGVLVGITASLKLTPLLFVAYFVVTRQWRQAAVALGTFFTLTIVSAALWPSEFVKFWTEVVTDTRRPLPDLAYWENWSIIGVFARRGWEGGYSTIAWLLLSVAILLLGLWWARAHTMLGDPISAAIILGCASAVVTPVGWIHYHVWTVLAFVWIYLRRGGQLIGAVAVFYFSLGSTVKYLFPASTMMSDVATLIPIVIALFGLPRSGSSTVPGTSTALDAATASATASDAGRQLDDSRGTNTANTDSPNGR